MRKQLSLLLVSISLGWVGCAPDKQADTIHLDRQLEYCDAQIRRTLSEKRGEYYAKTKNTYL